MGAEFKDHDIKMEKCYTTLKDSIDFMVEHSLIVDGSERIGVLQRNEKSWDEMIEMAKRFKDLNDENKSIFERILSLHEQETDDKFELLAHNLLYVTAQVQTIDSTFANDIILFVRNQI